MSDDDTVPDPVPDDEDRTPGHRSDEVDVVPLHTPRSWWTWILLLLGPVTWAIHFMGVYLAVEAWCGAAMVEIPEFLGAAAPVSVTLLATGVATLVIAAGTAFTALRYRQARDERERQHPGASDIDDQLVRDREMLLAGLLLGALSVIAVLIVGLSALWVPTC